MSYKENNHLIANFIGLRKGKTILWGGGETECYYDDTNKLADSRTALIVLNFHNDWKWIMTAVEKIESMGWDVMIEGKSCLIMVEPTEEDKISALGWEDEKISKIENVFNCVVSFVNWYNKNK